MTVEKKASRKICYLCQHQLRDLDYKDVSMLQRFTSPYAKIIPKKRTGVCPKHQRKVAKAIKQARFMALIPYTNR